MGFKSVRGCLSAEPADASKVENDRREKVVDYEIDDVPPWHLCLLLAFQHLLTMVSGIIAVPLLVAKPLCIEDSLTGYADDVGKTEIIASVMFTCGVATLIQATFGCRLPIIQGCAALLPPTFALLNAMGNCPAILPHGANMTDFIKSNSNSTDMVIAGSDEHRQIWQTRFRALQGAIMVASVFELVVGLSGVFGLIMRFIGPLVIAPTLLMIALPLFKLCAENAGNQWGISCLAVILILVFSEYMKDIKLPGCSFDRRSKSCIRTEGYPVFKLFPVALAMLIAYLLCLVFTYTDVFPNNPDHPLYFVRTDVRTKVISDAKWFRMPYPGQWGVPTVTLAGAVGMMSGVVALIIESIGDYHACAKLCGAPAPPNSAINRGIFFEGLGTLLAASVGTAGGTTSYSANIAAIGITKVGSRRVIQVSAFLMLLFGLMTKPMAVFVTIPPAVLGAMYISLFGLIAAYGISNLQYVNLNSSRNMLVIGIPIMMGLALPEWIENNKDTIKTGSAVVDDLIVVLLSTHMFIAGLIAFILDNSMPGTPEERGLTSWQKRRETSGEQHFAQKCYDMPFGNDFIYRSRWLSYVPISPSFMSHRNKSEGCDGKNTQDSNITKL